MKRTLIFSSVIAASIAFAAQTINYVQGSGAFADVNAGQITFSMNMKQILPDVKGRRPVTFGAANFRRTFSMLGNTYRQEFSLSPVRSLSKNGSTATFGGPGTLKVYRNGVLDWSIAGNFTAEVRDLRTADGDSTSPDWVGFRFMPGDGSPTMEFSGGVTSGDVSVYSLTQ